MMANRKLLGGLAVIAFIASAGAADYERATQAIIAGRGEEAVKELSSAAQAGEPRANALLGAVYEAGRGVTQDLPRAADYYRKAGEAIPTAQFRLGLMTLRGNGIPANANEGIRMMTFAAENGVPEASMALWRAYSEGVGVARDEAAAARWIQKAVDANYHAAHYQMYLLNRTSDPSAAVQWLRKAASADNAPAAFELGRLYRRGGDGIPRDEVESIRWLRAAANKDHAMAQGLLGTAYAEGKGVKQDFAEAARWFRKGAENRDATSQALLAVSYLEGKGLPVDKVEACAWFSVAGHNSDNPQRQQYWQLMRQATIGMPLKEIQRCEALSSGYSKKYRKPS